MKKQNNEWRYKGHRIWASPWGYKIVGYGSLFFPTLNLARYYINAHLV